MKRVMPSLVFAVVFASFVVFLGASSLGCADSDSSSSDCHRACVKLLYCLEEQCMDNYAPECWALEDQKECEELCAAGWKWDIECLLELTDCDNLYTCEE